MKTKYSGSNGKGGIGRRTVLKGVAATGGLAAGSGLLTGFPTIWAQNIKNVTLRQFTWFFNVLVSTLLDIVSA